MTQTTGTVIGIGITLTSITTGYLFLSTVSGGDFIQGTTILTTLPAIRITMTTVTHTTITMVTLIVTTTLLPYLTMMIRRAILIRNSLWEAQR